MDRGVSPTQDRMQAVIDSLPDPVVLLESVRDDAGRIVDFTYVGANAAALEANGVTRDELMGARVLDLFPGHGDSGLLDLYASVVESGDPAIINDHPYANEALGGEVHYYDTRATRLGDGLSLTWRDRTERHREREALERERATIRTTLDGLMDPVIQFTPVRDEQGAVVDFTFADANEAACAFNNATHDELVGSLLSVRYPDMWRLHVFEQFVAVAERGESLRLDAWHYTVQGTDTTLVLDLRGHQVPGGLTVTFRDVAEREQVAARLAESERRFRLLAEHASDVVVQADARGIITWVSPSVLQVTGVPASAFEGRPLLETIPRKIRESTRHILEETHEGVLPLQTPDAGLRWYAVRVSSLASEPEVDDGIVIGVRDVTSIMAAQREAEEARGDAERTRLSMDEAAIGLLLADARGRITFANPALHRIFRAPEGSIVGMSLTEGNDPADAAAVERMLDRVLYGQSETEHLRRRIVDAAGSSIWVDTFISPVRDVSGDVDGILGQVVDVTPEVANREALARSVQHFRVLAENASDVVYETDGQGYITWVSPSVQPSLGWSPDALLGTRATDLVHPDDLEDVLRERERVLTGGETRGYIARFQRMDGGVRYMAVTAHSITGDDGSVQGAVVGLHDVTNEALIMRRLERSERTIRTAMEGAPQGMAIANAQDLLTEVNPALEAILGEPKVSILGRRLADFKVPTEDRRRTCVEELIASGGSRVVEHEHELRPGPSGVRWISHAVSAVRDADGAEMFFVHHVTDVTERHLREEELGHRASHDPLTGLLNREGLLARLTDWLPVQRPGGLAVLFCDLDGLKEINDRWGHAAGDAVLKAVAHRIELGTRRGDIVGRFAGDEFIVVLDRIQSEEAARTVAEKICAGAKGIVRFEDDDLPAAVSIGLALAEPEETTEALLARADQALYRAKAAGRGRVST